jgi:6-phosphogluconolactonase (cycloisomerase 2 family)
VLSQLLSRHAFHRLAAILTLSCTGLLLVACGDDSVSSTSRYAIGGTVSGLVGTGLVLQDNGTDDLTITKNGAFQFATPLISGSSYAITVKTQPGSPSQNCIVTSGTGTVSGDAVTGVTVTCSTNGFTVGGVVNTLSGSGLVLQDNGGDDLPISSTGAFTFTNTVGSGSPYAVTVKTQPSNPTQICAVTNGSGTIGNTNVTNVLVSCSTDTYTVSGTIAGLVGTGLVLQTNGVTIPISGNTFSVSLPSGTAYNILVTTQPSGPLQNCTVANGSGTVTSANIGGVAVTCTTTQFFTLSGSITGLAGTGLVLQSNGTNVPISGNTFSVSLPNGASYNLIVASQPSNPTQTCVVSNGGPGTINNANVTASVACTTRTFTVSVNAAFPASGVGSGLTLYDNGGDSLAITGNGTFTFSNPVASGQNYLVSVHTQPTATPAQYCIVTDGSGTVTTANIVNVAVTCRTVGRALFAVNKYDGANGTVSGFTINPANGNLTANSSSPFTADVNPTAIALDTTGQYAYVANQTSFDISSFSVTEATAHLAFIGNTPTSGTQTYSAAVAPGGQFVFAGSDANPNGLVDAFDATAGVLAPLGSQSSGNDPMALAVDPSGSFVFASEQYDNNVTVLPVTAGVLGAAANYPAGSAPIGIAVYPAGGYLYVANSGDGTVSAYSYDGTTGALTTLANSPYLVDGSASSAPFGVAVDPTGRFLYVSCAVDKVVALFSIDPSTGLLTAVTSGGMPIATGTSPIDVRVDPSGKYLYVVNGDYNQVTGDYTIVEYTINPTTGVLTAAGSGGSILSGAGAAQMAIE